MNQISGLNYINMGGQQRPIKYGTNQAAIYCQTRGCTLAQYQADLQGMAQRETDGTQVRDFLFSALAAGYRSARLPEPLPFDSWQVGDWIDEMDQEELRRAFVIMQVQSSPNDNGAKPKASQEPAQEIIPS